jgi:hypothetical protein
MTSVENGADQAANDTTLTSQNTDTTQQDQAGADAGDAADQDQDQGADDQGTNEPVELEWDGKKWALPKDAVEVLKPALLRQADYTQKTQTLAEQRRAFEAEQAGFKGHVEAQKAHFQAATKLAATEDRMVSSPYFEVKDGAVRPKVNWANEYQLALQASAQDGGVALASYHQHKANAEQMIEDHRTASGEFSQKEKDRLSNEERASATRLQKTVADIAKEIPGWTYQGELDRKILAYGTSEGLSSDDIREMALRNPKTIALLNKARIADEAQAKQKTQQTFERQQQAAPVTRVGGSGGSAQRRTTDASGDGLSTEEWVKRERERVRKR